MEVGLSYGILCACMGVFLGRGGCVFFRNAVCLVQDEVPQHCCWVRIGEENNIPLGYNLLIVN